MTDCRPVPQIPILQTYPEGSTVEPREVIVMLTRVPCVGEAIRDRAGQLIVAAVTHIDLNQVEVEDCPYLAAVELRFNCEPSPDAVAD